MYYPIKPRGNRKIINSYIHHPSFKDVDIYNIITMLDEKKWTDAGVVTGESVPYKSALIVNKLFLLIKLVSLTLNWLTS